MGQVVEKQSRNGKKPVVLPDGVQATVSGREVKVKGPKGEIARTFRDEVDITQEGNEIRVSPKQGSGQRGTQFQGLTRALIQGMVIGTKEGFKKSLDLRGVGYRAEFKNGVLKMALGLSHQPELPIPKGIDIKIENVDEAGFKYPRVHLESVDKELVGRVAARIKSFRPPEPYQGKGIRYTGERIREKAGKSGK